MTQPVSVATSLFNWEDASPSAMQFSGCSFFFFFPFPFARENKWRAGRRHLWPLRANFVTGSLMTRRVRGLGLRAIERKLSRCRSGNANTLRDSSHQLFMVTVRLDIPLFRYLFSFLIYSLRAPYRRRCSIIRRASVKSRLLWERELSLSRALHLPRRVVAPSGRSLSRRI